MQHPGNQAMHTSNSSVLLKFQFAKICLQKKKLGYGQNELKTKVEMT